VPTGVPVLKKFSATAPAPLGWWSSQSWRATVTPYGLQGRPQWNSPPRNWKAAMWPWASTKPLTGAVGLLPRTGVPVALTCTSGKAVQPVAGTSDQRASSTAEWPRRPVEVTVRPRLFETLLKLIR
jgi:hypothetical protein